MRRVVLLLLLGLAMAAQPGLAQDRFGKCEHGFWLFPTGTPNLFYMSHKPATKAAMSGKECHLFQVLLLARFQGKGEKLVQPGKLYSLQFRDRRPINDFSVPGKVIPFNLFSGNFEGVGSLLLSDCKVQASKVLDFQELGQVQSKGSTMLLFGSSKRCYMANRIRLQGATGDMSQICVVEGATAADKTALQKVLGTAGFGKATTAFTPRKKGDKVALQPAGGGTPFSVKITEPLVLSKPGLYK